MPTRASDLRHIFAGGWATDFGPNAEVEIRGDGKVLIPFLVEADNLFYELDGGPHKIGGGAKLNSAVLEGGEEVLGIFDYWKNGGAATGTQKRIVHVGTKIKKDDADGTFDDLFTGLENDKVPCYTVFDDILIISSDSTTDVPKSWDQSTAQNLAGTPPNFAFSATHKDRVWAAGVVANPSTLYYCVGYDPEDWAGAGSGSIQIDPGDGDRITGLASFKNELWVFKGPYHGSIHRITGSAPTGDDAFARRTFIRGLGAVWHNLIVEYKDDLAFMWSDGTFHSLKATAAFGDFNEAALSYPINTFLRERVNHSRLRFGWAINNVGLGVVRVVLPIDSAQFPNHCISMDYRFDPPRWSSQGRYGYPSLGNVIDTGGSGQPQFMAGGSDGFVRKLDQSARTNDGAIAMRAKTPHFTYGNPLRLKQINRASVGIRPLGSAQLIFGWELDDGIVQEKTGTQGGGDVLAPGEPAFALGSSVLGGSNFAERAFDLEEGGEFSSIAYIVRNAGDREDLEVHSITAQIKPGAESGES
jgi:hypothetical protein